MAVERDVPAFVGERASEPPSADDRALSLLRELTADLYEKPTVRVKSSSTEYARW
jgi:hypothetical protein